MKRKHHKTLKLIFARPVTGSIKWSDIESLFLGLGAELSEREGSRIGIRLLENVEYFTNLILPRTQIKAQWQVSESG